MTLAKYLVFLATVFQLSSAKLTKIYDNSTFLDNANTSAIKFSWKYEPSQDVLHMALEVKATGWVGFGFANKIFRMQGYDVIVGKVVNGRGTLTDRHTVGYTEPLVDQQDYNMTYFEEVNGTTTLEFHRKRLTGDSKDLDIKLGPMLLVYAYHSTADYPSPYRTKHDHQGYKRVVLLPWDTKIPQNITSTLSPLAASTTTGLRSPIHTTTRLSSVAISTLMPSSSVVSTAAIGHVMSPSMTSSLYSSVHVPTFVVPDDVYEKYVKVGLRTKITNVRYEDIKDKTKPDYMKFKNELEKYLESRKNIWKAVITDIRKGSVIVDYDVYMNTSSLQETRQVIDDINRDAKKGRLGSFVVDPGYTFDPVITMKVPLKQKPSSSSIRTVEPTKNLILIIMLGCAVGLVFIMLLVIIALAIRIRKKFHHSTSYSLKPMGRACEYEVNY